MITALYAALLAVLLVFLSIYVVMGRWKYRTALGPGEFGLQRRIRAQANCAEYAPIFIILLYIAESGGLAGMFVHLLGAGFVAGRIAHAYSIAVFEQYNEKGHLDIRTRQFRAIGMGLTFFILLVLAAVLLCQFLGA